MNVREPNIALFIEENEMSIDDATPRDWDMVNAWRRVQKEAPALEKNPSTIQIVAPPCPCPPSETSDGSTASYYELPQGAAELQDLISFKSMNAQIGEIFRASYRYGEVAHSKKLRDAKKIKFYAEAEIKRLEAGGQ